MIVARSKLFHLALVFFGLLPTNALAAAIAPASAARPNIVIILSDDMGFSDLGCYGGEIATPHLDALAKDGLRFTQFYNGARCCPTRASLLTGLHPHQAGVGHMMEDRGHDGYRGTLNARSATLAEALMPAGYRSYAAGKWHVTPGQTARSLALTNNWPLQRGFDRFYGTIHGAGSFFDPSALVRDNRLITIANDPEYRPEMFYYTDAISDHAVRFVREHARENSSQPFLLYVAYTAAHWPMHAKDADIAKYKGRYDAGYEAVRAARLARLKELGLMDARWKPAPPPGRWSEVKDKAFEARCMEVYAAMVDCMDQGIGRIVAELKAQQQLDNTLIFYLQDNGGCAEGVGRGTNATVRAERPSLPLMTPDDQQFDSIPKQTRDGWPIRQGYGVLPGGPDTYVAYGREWAHVSNTPFREYKHWTHEGGIATPLIAHWPKGIPRERRGRLEKQPGQLVDIMATCLDAAGASYLETRAGVRLQPPEGASLRPAFTGESIRRSKPLVWEHESNRAVREGKWKLVAKENQPWELYDMEADRTESNDLASSDPARVKALAAAWDDWAARANVLPLGTWRKPSLSATSAQRRFTLKAGDHLDRGQAPAIARRGFTVTVRFDAKQGANGVLVAQGGSAHGYALFLAEGRLHFLARSEGRATTAMVPEPVTGNQQVTARLDAQGELTLSLNGRVATSASAGTPLTTMPADGLDVGRDSGGLVGPYEGPNPFTGSIESVVIDLDPL